MPNYSKSIIYKLECKDPKITEIYVGATTNFNRRRAEHKQCCINKDDNDKGNTQKYQIMRKHGGWNNWQMIMIDEVNARNKRHLNQIEAKYIKDLAPALNREIPQDIDGGLEREEWLKQYRTINKEKFGTYFANNKEKLKSQMKDYRIKNKEKLLQKDRERYYKNREIINEKAKKKIVCGCGIKVRKSDIVAHKKSIHHQEWEGVKKEDLVKNRKSEKIQCPCGSELRRDSLSRHKKSKQHQEWEKSQQDK